VGDGAVGLMYISTHKTSRRRQKKQEKRERKKEERKKEREIEGGKKKKGKASLRRGVGREGEMGGD
jgi:hypothetical protein